MYRRAPTFKALGCASRLNVKNCKLTTVIAGSIEIAALCLLIFRRGETAAEGVFCDVDGDQELEQVIGTAGF